MTTVLPARSKTVGHIILASTLQVLNALPASTKNFRPFLPVCDDAISEYIGLCKYKSDARSNYPHNNRVRRQIPIRGMRV